MELYERRGLMTKDEFVKKLIVAQENLHKVEIHIESSGVIIRDCFIIDNLIVEDDCVEIISGNKIVSINSIDKIQFNTVDECYMLTEKDMSVIIFVHDNLI